MKFLVCGGTGFIGSTFILNHLKNNPDDKIINLDNLSIGSNKENLKQVENTSNYSFIKDDIRNFDSIITITKDVDIIVNFAAETHVDRSIANPKPFIDTNIVGTLSLLEAVRKHDLHYIHISTDELYGDAKGKESFTEESPLNPSNPYAASKASSDLLVKSYYRTYGIGCLISRCTNNFGPSQFPEKLIPKTIIRAIKGLKIPLYDGGHQVRSWIHVLDHVNAIESLISKGKFGEVYNITAYNEQTNRDVVKKILTILGKDENLIQDVQDRPGHDERYSVNASKIQQLGWKPEFKFEQALEQTVEWYQKNQSWWEPLANERTLHPQPWTLSWKK